MAAQFLGYSWLASLSNLACTQPFRSSFCPTHKGATTLAGPLGLTLQVGCPWPKVARGNFLAGTCQIWHVLDGLEKARFDYLAQRCKDLGERFPIVVSILSGDPCVMSYASFSAATLATLARS